MARRQNRRSKPKKKINRYNPNNPDWHAVHSPLHMPRLFSPPPLMVGLLDNLFAALVVKTLLKRA